MEQNKYRGVVFMAAESNNIFKDLFKLMEEQTGKAWFVCAKIEAEAKRINTSKNSLTKKISDALDLVKEIIIENTRELFVDSTENIFKKVSDSAKVTEELILESRDNMTKYISDSVTQRKKYLDPRKTFYHK
jgi:aspartyl-tRNA synthetase